MLERPSRDTLEAQYADTSYGRRAWPFEEAEWQYEINIVMECAGDHPAPSPSKVTIISSKEDVEKPGTVTCGGDDRRRFSEFVFLLAAKLKYDLLGGVPYDEAGFLCSQEISRLNDAKRTDVQKATHGSIMVLYRNAKNGRQKERTFLDKFFVNPDQLWHLFCRWGHPGATAATEDLIWWLDVRPEDVSFGDSSGRLIDDGTLKKLLDKLFPKSCLLAPAEYRALLKRLGLESPLAAGTQSGLRTGEGIEKSIEVNQDEERPAIRKVALGPRGESVSVDDVLEYLRDLAEECAELPYYFPAHLKHDGPGKSGFENIRQTVRVIEDRQAFRKRLEEECGRLRRKSIYPDAVAYSPSTAMSGEADDDNGPCGVSAETILWDPQASQRFSRTTILGEPGCGKSWLLRYEAQRLAHEAIDILQNNKGGIYDVDLPVLIKLPALARRDEDLEYAIVGLVGKDYRSGFCGYLRKQLISHHCVLLLDAWDEVSSLKSRRRLGDRIHTFARRCQTRILLTSRIVGYELTPPPLQQGNELEVLAWDWPQIESYVRNWFGAEQGNVSGFLSRLRRHPQCRGLARSPLMLMLLCRTCPQGDFPSRRSDLYEACLRGLLRDWHIQDKDRYTEIQLSDGYVDELLEILEEVSLELHEKGMQEFTERDLARMLKASLSNFELKESRREILREKATPPRLIKRFKDDGILVSATTDGGRLRFLHLTFQEYLVARALAKRPDCVDKASEYVYEPAWNGVLTLVGGLLDQPRPYIAALYRKNREDILWRPFFLAIQAAGEMDCRQLPKKVIDSMACLVSLSYGCLLGFQRDLARRAIRHHGQIADGVVADAVLEPRLLTSAMKMLGDIGSERAVPFLVKALAHKEEKVRQGAAKALRLILSEQAVPALVGALQDTDAQVRSDAVEALAQIRSENAIPALVEVLQGENPDARREAVWVLGQIGSEKAIRALAKALKDKGAGVDEAAAAALGEIGSEKAVPALFEAIQAREKEQSVRLVAAQALGTIGAEEVVPSLVELLQETQDRDVRVSAAAALKLIGSDEAVYALCELLNDPCEHVRSWAVLGLGGAQSEKALPALHKAFRDESLLVPFAAVIALKQLGSKEAVAVLCEALRHDFIMVRDYAVWALGHIGSEEEVPVLVELLYDSDKSFVQAAANALGRIGSKKAIPALMEALRDEDRPVCEAAAKALGQIGSEEAIPALVGVLLNKESAVRPDAAMALGQIGSKEAIPALAEALQDEEPRVAGAAAAALGEIGSEEATPALVKGLAHKRQSVRRVAAEALGRIGSEKAVPDLVEMLEDRDAEARWSAAEALDDVDALRALRRAMPDDSVLYAVAKALGMIGSERALPVLLSVLEHQRFPNDEIVAEALMRIRPNQAFQFPTQSSQDPEACSESDRVPTLRNNMQSLADIMDNLAEMCEDQEQHKLRE